MTPPKRIRKVSANGNDTSQIAAAELQAQLTQAQELVASLAGRLERLESHLYNLELDRESSEVSEHDARDARSVRSARQAVRSLPEDASVAVVSKGDERLLDLHGRDAGHFPQDEDGRYLGFYPEDGTAVVAHLETLRARGAQYLVFPTTSLWWLTEYPKFASYLDTQFQRVEATDSECAIYELTQLSAPHSPIRQLWEIHDELRTRVPTDPVILDWQSGLNLTSSLPTARVFPVTVPASGSLPFLDNTADIVVIRAGEPALPEAERVAARAVAISGEGAGELRVQWKADGQGDALPSTSIVIPSYNGERYLEILIPALGRTVPEAYPLEIIVVDDCSTDGTRELLRALSKSEPRLRPMRNRTNQGFLRTCNRGAAAATGDVIVLLNNDTIPLRGWLSTLLRTLRDAPDAGAVGGKMVYPNGVLQEAGAVIFNDGSCANFGRWDPHPDDPLYNYVRPVDYCSAALLATPSRLWRELGGFDERFRPIYYEDTDYCMKVRKAGLEVYYQPESAIVHAEGSTSGTDLSRGDKRYQAEHQAAFVEKWEAALRAHPAHPGYFDFDVWNKLEIRGVSA